MRNRIMVVDYGMGNLHSVRRALEVNGAQDIAVSARPDDLDDADRVVLPGVGAFADGMRGLAERGFVGPLRAYARTGRPLLGICLGMQMLATASEEFGVHAGLNLIPGRVVAIPHVATDGRPLKVPFIGWTALVIDNQAAREGSLLQAHAESAAVYLVHSFHVVPADPAHRLASYDFGGHRVTAAIRRENITGFQFHPEKSGAVGLEIVRHFVAGRQ